MTASDQHVVGIAPWSVEMDDGVVVTQPTEAYLRKWNEGNRKALGMPTYDIDSAELVDFLHKL